MEEIYKENQIAFRAAPDEEYEEEYEEIPEEEEEEYEEEYEEEPVSSEEEGEAIEVEYRDASGKTVSRRLTKEELADLLSQHEQLASADKAELINYVQQAEPIISIVRDSQLMKDILYYRAQGYTDEQIKEGLYKLWSDKKESGEQQTTEAPKEERDKLLEEIEKRIKPIEQTLATYQTSQFFQSLLQHNNEVLAQAMSESGVSDFTPEEYKKIAEALKDMYPGVDLRLLRLTPTAARAIVKLVLHDRLNSPRKQKGLPKIVEGGGVAKPSTGKNVSRTGGYRIEDRIRLKQELMT